VTCSIEVTPIHQILVVCEFPDVFPDELVLRTALILRRPYRMPPDELAELKKQLEDSLKKEVYSTKQV
jgi:hypothetical protein